VARRARPERRGRAGRLSGIVPLREGFNPLPARTLADRLRRFRMENNLTYRAKAKRITELHPRTLRRAVLGGPSSARVVYRIERFLEGAGHAL
jgi:hypothetical protein